MRTAAFAMARGYELIRLDVAPGGRRVFVFNADVERDINDHYTGGVVSGKRLLRSMDDLRSLTKRARA